MTIDVRAPGTLFERVAYALSSTLELESVLELLARAGLEATGAGGTAVLLLDGCTLRPATVVRTIEDGTLQSRFHGMTPVQLDQARLDLLAAGTPIVLEDARQVDLIPRQWVELFNLRGVALVPLLASGAPAGLLVVDWDEVRAFSPEDVALLEAIAAYAGLAIGNARLFAAMRRRAHVQALLARSAAHLAAPVPPDEIAGRLADDFGELLDARLCAVAVLDARWRQITTMAMRGGPMIETPIPFSAIPQPIVEHLIASLTAHRRPVELDHADWFGTFLGGEAAGAATYVAVPVVVGDYARALVLLGLGPGQAVDDDAAGAAEVLAGIAAAALERHELLARLDTQVNRLAAVQGVSAALNSSASLAEVLEVVCSAFESILGTSHCSVNVLGGTDPCLLRTLAHRGVPWFAGRPESISALSRRDVATLVDGWQVSPGPVVLSALDSKVVPHAVQSAALFPLTHGDLVAGVVVAGFPHARRPTAAALEAGQSLADLAASAIDRAQLTEDLHVRLRQVEVLYRLSDVVAVSTDVAAVVADLNRSFRADLGGRVAAIAVPDRGLREALGARAPSEDEATAIRSWRAEVGRGSAPRPRPTAAGLLIPVVHGRRVHGALRVTLDEPSATPAQEELLQAIGAGCGEILHKAALHREVAERERRLTIASERERIARDLHDSVGQVITGIGMLVADYRAAADDPEWQGRLERLAELADRGAREVRESIHALLFLQARRQGLVASLRGLAKTFEGTTGVRVQVAARGAPTAVTPAAEDALFRAAHEALMNVDRHARASLVRISVSYRADRVVVTVADDGVGLPARVPGVDGGHFGLTSVRRRLEEVGGSFGVARGGTSGTVATARVPTSRAATKRARG